MENENDKKIDEWFSLIGPEKFTAINKLIDDTVEQVGNIVAKDEFLAAVEAKLFRFAAHIITVQECTIEISREYEYCEIPNSDIVRIDPILKAFISDPLIRATSTQPKKPSTENIPPAPSPADMLARLNQGLTKPTTLAPTRREYSAPTAPLSAPVAKPTIDLYRELPEK